MGNYIDLHIQLKRYDDRPIFQNEEVGLPNNGLFFLLGENGCGKSTLLNILSTRDRSFEGTYKIGNILLDKKNCSSICDSKISYVPQVPVLLDDKSVLDNLLFVFPHADRSKALSLLERMSLKDRADQPASNLSTGEKQRLNLSRGLFEEKQILLVDEITSNLDKENAFLILKALKEYSIDHLVIFASHDERFDGEFKGSSINIKNKHITIDNTKYHDKELKETTYPKFSFLYEIKRFFKEEKLFCSLTAVLIFLLQFFLIGQAYFKGFADNSYFWKYREIIYENTFPALYLQVADMDDIDEELNHYTSANQILSDGIGLKKDDDDYRFGEDKGEVISVILKFCEENKQNLDLLCGTYPAENGDIIISNICFDTILKENNVSLDYESALKDDKLTKLKPAWGDISLKITGIYKSLDASLLEKKLDGINPEDLETFVSQIERQLLGYKVDSAFGILSKKQTNGFIVENTPENLRIAKERNKSLFPDGTFLYTTMISNKDSKDHITKLNSISRVINRMETPVIVSLCFFLASLLVVFFFKNRLRYPLRLLLGEREKRLKFYPVIAVLLLCLASFVLSYLISIGILGLFHISIAKYYDFLIGFWYSKMNFTFLLPLVISMVIPLLFFLIIRHAFFGESRMKALIKEK